MNIYKKSDIPEHLQKYFEPAEIGKEKTPAEFVTALVAVFREVKRVLRDDGTLWLNIGDSYANDGKWGGSSGGKHARALHGNTAIGRSKVQTGVKPKNLIGIPWRLAFALQDDGWILRQEIIWSKPNPMPESMTDRCTKSHESIFLLAKSEKYYFDAGAIKEPAAPSSVQRWAQDMEDVGASETRNKRSVWTVATVPYKGAHFATFPPALIEPCILAGAPSGGVVLDPFFGSGTTGQVAQNLGRKFIGCELSPANKPLQDERLRQPSFEFLELA